MHDSKLKHIQNEFWAIGRVEKEGGGSVLLMVASRVLWAFLYQASHLGDLLELT